MDESQQVRRGVILSRLHSSLTADAFTRDFAEIFGDLLPGNTCKLQAPEGKTISDGLEVKVCLGGVWKQSLTELSGGQR